MNSEPQKTGPARSDQKGWRQFHLLWQLMSGFRLLYAGAILALLAGTVVTYLVPLVGRATIDYAIGTAAHEKTPVAGGLTARILDAFGGVEVVRENLWLPAIAMVALTVIAGLFSYLKGKGAALASDGIARQLKDQLYDHLHHLPASYHDTADTGDLVQRCTSDVETLRMAFSTQVVEVSHALILMLTAIPVMLYLDGRMTAISFALILPMVTFGYTYFNRVKHLFLDVDQAEAKVTTVVQENLTGIRVVRAFARQDHEIRKFAEPNAGYRDQSLRMVRIMSIYWSASDLITLSQYGLVIITGIYFIGQGTLSVGTLFAFVAFLDLFLWPVRQMGRILTDLGKTVVAIGRTRDILAVPHESAGGQSHSISARMIQGRIEIDDLWFSHRTAQAGDSSERPHHALNGVSLRVEPGESLAILGPSGSGKSTIIHLLLRLYDYTRGSVRIDGVELTEYDRKWIRSQFGVVMQEPFLYSKTLEENIRLGSKSASRADIMEAAQMAHIHETILSFDHGYETQIGERGITLSGGQRQRVALARAIVRDPPILVLDDALSAVDSETESTILNALQGRHGQKTTIVIAHRLSTLAHADRIIVLEAGRVIQEGRHEDLIVQDGLYQRLWRIQSSLESDFQRELTHTV
ncbi:MAG: ABC transporter ATP-binding protein [Opitutaceae bacterium]